MVAITDEQRPQLGAVQEALFIPVVIAPAIDGG
jgi:hypothetical protein